MWSLTWRIEYILLFRKGNKDIEKAIAVVGLDNISTTNLAKTYTSVNFKESSYSQLISNVSRDCWLLHTKPFIVKKKYMQMRILCKFKEKRNIRKLEQHKRNLKPQNQLWAVDISTILFSTFVPNNIFLPDIALTTRSPKIVNQRRNPQDLKIKSNNTPTNNIYE